MKLDITRAWKDEVYRQSLSAEQSNLLPANPAGELELTDTDLEAVFGGGWGQDASEHVYSYALVACEINIFTISILSNLFEMLGASSTYCGTPK